MADAKRNAKIELTASSAGMDRGLGDARRKLRTFQRDNARQEKQAERDAARSQKRLLSGARGVAGALASGFGMAVGLNAAGGIAGMATDVLDYEKALTRLQITADKSPDVMRAYSEQVRKASDVTGLGRNEILQASSAYVALTGDMETAQRSTETWARIAQATGTPIADIASTAAAMSQQLGITSDQMESVFSGLAAQGKAGAVELKDLAGLMAQIAPMWAQFKDGKGAKGVADLGAALQIVKRGFGGDAGETVTGLQSLLVALTKNAGRFEEGGVKVFDVSKDGTKTMKDVFSIIDAISRSKLVKDPAAMEKAFGRVEAYRAYTQLVENRTELEKMVDVARDGTLIQRDFATYSNSAAGKLERAWTNAKNAIADAFTPERIKMFAEAVAKAAEIFAKIVGYVDKVASTVEKAANYAKYGTTESPDEQAERRSKGYLAFDNSLNMSPAEKRAQAQRSLQLASNIYTKPGGYSDTEGVQIEALRKEARALIMQGDTWGAAGAKASTPVARDYQGKAISDPIVQKVEMEQTARALIPAMADAFRQALSSVPTGDIKIGSEPIQKAGANSINHRKGR